MCAVCICKVADCERPVDQRALWLYEEIKKRRVRTEILVEIEGCCEAHIRDTIKRRSDAAKTSPAIRPPRKNPKLSNPKPWNQKPGETSLFKICLVMKEDRARVRAWLVDNPPGVLKVRIVPTDSGREFVLVDKASFFAFLERLEQGRELIAPEIPEYLYERWHANLPAIYERIANGALEK